MVSFKISRTKTFSEHNFPWFWHVSHSANTTYIKHLQSSAYEKQHRLLHLSFSSYWHTSSRFTLIYRNDWRVGIRICPNVLTRMQWRKTTKMVDFEGVQLCVRCAACCLSGVNRKVQFIATKAEGFVRNQAPVNRFWDFHGQETGIRQMF